MNQTIEYTLLGDGASHAVGADLAMVLSDHDLGLVLGGAEEYASDDKSLSDQAGTVANFTEVGAGAGIIVGGTIGGLTLGPVGIIPGAEVGALAGGAAGFAFGTGWEVGTAYAEEISAAIDAGVEWVEQTYNEIVD